MDIGTAFFAVVFGYSTRDVGGYAGVEAVVGALEDVDKPLGFSLFHGFVWYFAPPMAGLSTKYKNVEPSLAKSWERVLYFCVWYPAEDSNLSQPP